MDAIETKFSALEDIKLSALYIEKRFMSNDPGETMLAESDLAALQNRFCDECRDFITPPMAMARKKERFQHVSRCDRLGAGLLQKSR